MKKYGAKLTAGLLTFAMTASSLTPAFAAPANTAEATESSSEIVLSQTAQDNIAAARIIGSMGNVIESTEDEVQEETPESKLKDAIKNWIFNGFDGNLDLSRFGITSEEMDNATAEVLDETGMANAADVTYETDEEGQVTTAEVEMDPMIVMAAEELKTVYNLSEAQSQELLGMYAQYLQLCEDNADIFGVQVPYNTTRDTNSSPIGSLLDIASIPEEYALAGYVDYETLSGIVQLYYLGTQFAVSEYADEIKEGRDAALSVLEDGMTEMQEYLALNDWLADNCQFAMDYIMPEMVEPEPAENQLYTYAYNCMYNMIKQQVYDGTYDALKDVYGEDQAKAIATQQSEAFMVDVQEEGGSGEQQAASTASTIVGMWGSNPVGVFVNKKAVCFGYANVYAYLQQCAHPEIYLKDGATDINEAANWKSYKELNYELDSEGNPVKDEDGNYKWSKDSAAIVDYVKIIFDADVTMFGQDSSFGECHYWNAVRLDGQWYYVDPCYVDIYIECMNRDRVETDGNLNHLYFMFSDASCREMYEDNFKEIRTLYENIATDQTYEEAWVAFVKSQPYKVGDKIYYLYDSTDLLDIMRNYGNGGNSNSRADNNGSVTDYEGLFTDTEYKIVYHDNASMADTSDEYSTLIDFNNGQVHVPASEEGSEGGMVDNELIAELFEEHQAYVEEYPSISISCAYYDGKIYFSLSNCVLSYDIGTGTVEKLIEYTEVSGERDMSKGLGGLAFTMTSGDPGTNGITVKNPPIADMTIKRDGKMYVSVATNYAFISGKDFGQLTDYSSYGYQFAESNYQPSYNSYYNNSESNDNDEFMWSANIVGTIAMSHLTGTDHSYGDVAVPASCTEDEYTVNRCSECGLIQETAETEDEAETVDEGDDGESTDPETKNVASLSITVTAGEGDNAVEVGKDTLTHTRGEEDTADSYTFSETEISEFVGTIKLTDGYVLSESNSYGAQTVAYGESVSVSYRAEKKAETVDTDVATLNITVNAVEGENTTTVASTKMTSEKGTVGEPYTFEASAIEETVKALTLAEGYVLSDNTYAPVTVDYGSSENVAYAAEKEAEKVAAVLNITVEAKNGEETKTVGSTMMISEAGIAGEKYIFTGAAIQEKVEALTLDEGYMLSSNNTYVDTPVAYGESEELVFAAEEKNQPATLIISVVAGEGEDAQEVGSDSLSEVGEVGKEATFTKEAIQEKAESIELPENYELAEYEYEDVAVAYGKSSTITLNAVISQEKAVVEIKVYDAATIPEEDAEDAEEPTVVAEATLEEVGNKGETKEYTVDEIKDAIAEKVTEAGYELDESTLPTENVSAVYGGDTVTVELKASEIPTGAGHTYIKFNETYYTKDDGGNWQTGTSYVCIDCGHAFELEDDETVEDHLRSNDKVLTDDEVASYAGNTTKVWTWSTDKTEASMYTVPTDLMSHKFDCIWENPLLSTREVAAVSGDCTTGQFTATLTSGETETASVTAGNHSYQNQEKKDDAGNVTQEAAVQWTWSDDLSKATVTFLCDVCGNTTTVEVSKDDNTDEKKMAVESTAATCTENGSDKYTATVVVNGVNYISSRTVETDPATGHTYGEDGKCTVCGEEKPTLDTPVISSVYSKLQTTAKVTWNKVTNAVGYELWRATSMDDADDEWSRVKTVTGDDIDKYTDAKNDTLCYTNVDLKVGQTYYYKVRAFKLNADAADQNDETARNYSEFSAVRYMPAAVVFANSYSNSTSAIRLLWNEIDGAHGYQIWRMNDDGTYSIVKTIGDKGNTLTEDKGSTTAYTNTGLETGKTYTYKMRAFSIPEEGTKVFGAYSDEIAIAVMPEAPVVSGSSSNTGRATLKWDSVYGAAGYQVWMATSQDGDYSIVKSITDGSATSYTKYELTSGSTYYFKVRAYTEIDGKKTFGAYSNVADVTVK